MIPSISDLIIYEDEDLIVINKPYGYFVHKSSLDAKSEQILMYPVRDYVGSHVYPIHRLDRKTTGVLLFAKSKNSLIHFNKTFEERRTIKTYVTICRGFMQDEGMINYPLKTESGKLQEAITRYRVIQKSEIDLAHKNFTTSRYSLVMFYPETGRMHQIRRHAAHIFHPIVADRPHGCNKQNKLLGENLDIHHMPLHAISLVLLNEKNEVTPSFFAPIPPAFTKTALLLGFQLPDYFSDPRLFLLHKISKP